MLANRLLHYVCTADINHSWLNIQYQPQAVGVKNCSHFFMFCQLMYSLGKEFKRTSLRRKYMKYILYCTHKEMKYQNNGEITNDLLKWPDWRFMFLPWRSFFPQDILALLIVLFAQKYRLKAPFWTLSTHLLFIETMFTNLWLLTVASSFYASSIFGNQNSFPLRKESNKIMAVSRCPIALCLCIHLYYACCIRHP